MALIRFVQFFMFSTVVFLSYVKGFVLRLNKDAELNVHLSDINAVNNTMNKDKKLIQEHNQLQLDESFGLKLKSPRIFKNRNTFNHERIAQTNYHLHFNLYHDLISTEAFSREILLEDKSRKSCSQNNARHYHHFARHNLCSNTAGRARFYTALRSKLCLISKKFIAQLVDDLCRLNDRHLNNWVAELFDLNEDGFVDHFERNIYEADD